MSLSLLPPRYVLVPASLVYNKTIPETVRFTYVMLRGLAWGSSETPAISMDQLTSITGKKQSAIYKHMAMLRDRGALLWRPAGCRTLIVSFPDCFQEDGGVCFTNSAEVSVDNIPSTFLESPVFKLNQESIFNGENIKNTSFHENGKDSGNLSSIISTNVENYSQSNHSKNGVYETNSKGFVCDQGTETSKGLGNAPSTAAYKSITNLTPNRPQRRQILDQVSDVDLWRATLDHWLAHGWNPRNVLGMLNLYTQGGPDSCRFCHPKKEDSEPPIVDYAAQRELDRIEAKKIIEDLRAKKAIRENSSDQDPEDPAESTKKNSPTDQTSICEV